MSALRQTIGHVAFAGLLLFGVGVAHAAELTPAQSMSAYLRYIATYTTWPNVPENNSDLPILIGVVGEDPNGVMALIKAGVASKKGLLAQDRPIRVVDLQLPMENEESLEILASCALLFVSEGARDDWALIQPAITRLPIVTVSEMKGFAERGGMIELFVDRRAAKLRMKINLRVMHDSGIILNSIVLNLDSVILLREEDA